MIIVTNTAKIKKGEGYKLINRFDKEGKIESMEGFLGLEVLNTEKLDDYDEVTISTRWESDEAFKNWTASDAFKEAHQHKGGKPDYILENKISYYEVKITRKPVQVG
ncbi:MAG TPA: heme oxygenase [Candidatus Pseudogracilibacillus intestinigallinarum]|uniref:Heme-degrading monooxygenase n=1 Tax=Candidatus Pseudogracilibacillus intestinigallinarum TaxID=2838742 RepID=A0A9D1TL26_9BACI|nr:heme oxygenase [Candidatus Pseudogracilibacillus intestinigallinarum]